MGHLRGRLSRHALKSHDPAHAEQEMQMRMQEAQEQDFANRPSLLHPPNANGSFPPDLFALPNQGSAGVMGISPTIEQTVLLQECLGQAGGAGLILKVGSHHSLRIIIYLCQRALSQELSNHPSPVAGQAHDVTGIRVAMPGASLRSCRMPGIFLMPLSWPRNFAYQCPP